MRLIDEICALSDADPEQESESPKKQRNEYRRKYYTYYVALGALKNFGFRYFETADGKPRTFSELIKKPSVADAKEKIYYPRRDGTMLDINDNIILTGKE